MAQSSQDIDSLTNQAIDGQVPESSSEVDEVVLQCQKEAKDSIQKLQAQAAKAGVPERLKFNLRVKALEILMARLDIVSGEKVNGMPTDEEVRWAKSVFALDQ